MNWMTRILAIAGVTLFFAGCPDRGDIDWIGFWDGGDPVGDDDDATPGDDDDATPGDDDDDATHGDDDDATPGDDDDATPGDDDDATPGDDDDDDATPGDDDDTVGDDDDTVGDDDDTTPGDDDDDDTLPGDGDGDGWTVAMGDCDDADPDTYPGATPQCDGVDNDCDGVVDAIETDDDGDGASECDGDCDDTTTALNLHDFDHDGWTTCDGDCDDFDDTLDPVDGDGDGASSCDGDCDDGDVSLNVMDIDGDGFTTCDGDCDDGDPDLELADADLDGYSTCDGDCDDGDPNQDPADADVDGYSSCDGDCDDADATSHPFAAELCDGADNDCDGSTPADEADDDLDGHRICDGDCDDTDATAYPGAAEDCGFGVDENCDGDVDEGCTCPLYVNGSIGGSLGQGTWDEPYLTLAAGFANLGGACVEIHVAPGTYSPGPDLDHEDLILRSIDGAATTFIDGGGSNRCMKFKNGDLVLDGFTLQNGVADKGAGLRLEGTTTTAEVARCVFEANACTNDGYGAGVYVKNLPDFWMHDCVLLDNDCNSGDNDNGSDGGGLFTESVDMLVEDNEFLDNLAGDGGGMAIEGSMGTVRRNLIAGNTATDNQEGLNAFRGGGGIAVYLGTMVFDANVILANHTTDRGGGIYTFDTTSQVFVDNCTVVDNTSIEGGGGIHTGDNGTIILRNTIVAYNDGTAGIDSYSASFQPIQTYCDVFDNFPYDYGSSLSDLTGYSGNISLDPLFFSWSDNGVYSDDDLHLDPMSSCVDTGDPAVQDADGTPCDMGAYGGPHGGW